MAVTLVTAGRHRMSGIGEGMRHAQSGGHECDEDEQGAAGQPHSSTAFQSAAMTIALSAQGLLDEQRSRNKSGPASFDVSGELRRVTKELERVSAERHRAEQQLQDANAEISRLQVAVMAKRVSRSICTSRC